MSDSVVVGITNRSFNKDTSAIKTAFIDACHKFIKYKKSRISGSEVYLTGENGKVFIGDTLSIKYDTSSIEIIKKQLKILDTLKTDNLLAIIAAPGTHVLDQSLKKTLLAEAERPHWVDKIPDETNYYYSLGIAEQYYYELSSWKTAENNAFIDMAKQVNLKTSILTKLDLTYYEIQNNTFDVLLQNINVAARWKDNKNKIYYVLFKMPK